MSIKPQNSTRQINFDACLDYISRIGITNYGSGFHIQPDDHEITFKLLVYFFKDNENAEKLNLNLKKGILLTGPVGCGKTSLMSIMRYFMQPAEQHIMKSTREITLEFVEEGFTIINKYARSSFQKSHGTVIPKTICFDDLGLESSIKYYGNDTNVMAEILLSRYDLFISRRMITHATTNLNAREVETIYGNRIRSRMREMFNLIAFSNTSQDKRV